jgi:hypothetical protein
MGNITLSHNLSNNKTGQRPEHALPLAPEGIVL